MARHVFLSNSPDMIARRRAIALKAVATRRLNQAARIQPAPAKVVQLGGGPVIVEAGQEDFAAQLQAFEAFMLSLDDPSLSGPADWWVDMYNAGMGIEEPDYSPECLTS